MESRKQWKTRTIRAALGALSHSQPTAMRAHYGYLWVGGLSRKGGSPTLIFHMWSSCAVSDAACHLKRVVNFGKFARTNRHWHGTFESKKIKMGFTNKNPKMCFGMVKNFTGKILKNTATVLTLNCRKYSHV